MQTDGKNNADGPQIDEGSPLAPVQTERVYAFERRCAALQALGYSMKKRTLGSKEANAFGALAGLIPCIAAVVIFVFVSSPRALFPQFVAGDFFLTAAAAVVSLFVHECLHAFGWAAVKGGFSGIRPGIAKPYFNPYCTCSEPICRSGYLFGGLLPFLLLGVGLTAWGIVGGYTAIFVLGAFNMIASGADLLLSVFALFSGCGLCLDHPNECGFYFFRKK